jgi:SAM-dependent methyltransferase
VPHDSWASVYDRVYEQTFGAFYANLTDTTLAVIASVAPPRGRIVDFGAGTGRLSIPLARAGYAVTAVEQSALMLAVLQAKAVRASLETARAALKPGGLLLIDVPERVLFRSSELSGPDVRRRVTITPVGDGVFRYQEDTDVRIDGRWTNYRDDFRIRHWDAHEIETQLSDAGFVFDRDCSPEFAGTGSRYWLWRKPPRD